MKYMLLIYGNEEKWTSLPPAESAELVNQTEALLAELRASGELVGAYGVADQADAKMVVTQDGVTAVTDGPYIEAKEYLGSFTIVDCDGLDRALEIAALNPAVRLGGVEVRALPHESDGT